ncbi:hypothetical protein Tco_0777318 [Tanacetum coccineum]
MCLLTLTHRNPLDHGDPNLSIFHRLLFHVVQIVQIWLWIIDSGCSKHMTRNLKPLINFVEKFMGTIRFGNDHYAAILGYGDLVQGNIVIKWVYYEEGLGHDLYSVVQFYNADVEVAYRKNTCFITNLEGVDYWWL